MSVVVSKLDAASESDEASVSVSVGVRVRDGSGNNDGRAFQSRTTTFTWWKS